MAVEAPERIKSNLDDVRNRAAKSSAFSEDPGAFAQRVAEQDLGGVNAPTRSAASNNGPSRVLVDPLRQIEQSSMSHQPSKSIFERLREDSGIGAPLPARLPGTLASDQPADQPEQQGGLSATLKSGFDAVRNRARAKKEKEDGADEKEKKPASDVEAVDMDAFFKRTMWFSVAGLIYDAVMAALDFLGTLGSWISLVGNFVMWGLYWIVVWREMPKSLRGDGMLDFSKARKHFIFNMIIESIPIVGQIWIGWTGIGVDAYLLVLAERKKIDITGGDKKKEEGKKDENKESKS